MLFTLQMFVKNLCYGMFMSNFLKIYVYNCCYKCFLKTCKNLKIEKCFMKICNTNVCENFMLRNI